jgi:hypothetical protein
LSFVISIPIYNVDTRANRIENWTVVASGPVSLVYLCTSDDVAEHVASILIHRGFRVSSLAVTDPTLRRVWTHCLEVSPAVDAEATATITLLTEVLVLRRPPGLASGIALDWYKDPTTDEDPNKWSYTQSGQMLYDGKYRKSGRQATALCDRLAVVVESHAIYRDCAILTVPGSNSTIRSFSEKIAGSVAKRTGQDLIRTTARTPERAAAKTGVGVDLKDEFTVEEAAAGRRILIVDDLYRSGGTLKAVAEAAKRARAIEIHGLAGARTMRK